MFVLHICMYMALTCTALFLLSVASYLFFSAVRSRSTAEESAHLMVITLIGMSVSFVSCGIAYTIQQIPFLISR